MGERKRCSANAAAAEAYAVTVFLSGSMSLGVGRNRHGQHKRAAQKCQTPPQQWDEHIRKIKQELCATDLRRLVRGFKIFALFVFVLE